jgi:orotate phosphoribosyltransferase
MAADDLSTLLDLLVKYAYDYKKGGFKLAGGQSSDEYIDCKMALSQPGALLPLGNVFLSHLNPRVNAVGGLTLGADPIAHATCISADMAHRPLRWFTVRKIAKEHGHKKMVEGAVAAGDLVAVVDDVVTRGGSTIDAIEKCRALELNVAQALVLVDREEDGGLQKIKDVAGPDVEVVALFTKSMIHTAWLRHRQTLRATA